MKTLDIIIATYNRHNVVSELIEQLQKLNDNLINKIIIVDSSDICLQKKDHWVKTTIIHSNRKSQPYQRYLGYKNSESEYLLFLDDDMEVIDVNFASKILNIFNQNIYVGINLKFENKNIFLEKNKNKSIFSNFKNGFFIRRIRWFFGYPILKENKFSWNGNKGKRKENKSIEYVSGGAFTVKKDCIFINFNKQIFDIFEQKIAMGEDSIIGYLISKKGKILADNNIYFFHNDTSDSSYTNNKKDFAKKVVFSRWYLSKEYARINNFPLFLANIIFGWYAIWRFVALIINFILSRIKSNEIIGFINGIKLILLFKYNIIYAK